MLNKHTCIRNQNSFFVCTARSPPHSISLKSNEAYCVHSETRDTLTDYYENVIDESKADEANTCTEEPLYESVPDSGEGI